MGVFSTYYMRGCQIESCLTLRSYHKKCIYFKNKRGIYIMIKKQDINQPNATNNYNKVMREKCTTTI